VVKRMRTEFWWGNLQGKSNLQDINVRDEMIILKLTSVKQDGTVCELPGSIK